MFLDSDTCKQNRLKETVLWVVARGVHHRPLTPKGLVVWTSSSVSTTDNWFRRRNRENKRQGGYIWKLKPTNPSPSLNCQSDCSGSTFGKKGPLPVMSKNTTFVDLEPTWGPQVVVYVGKFSYGNIHVYCLTVVFSISNKNDIQKYI